MADKKAIWDAGMLASELKRGIHGAFVFYGEEDYLKSYYRDAVAKAVLTEGFEAFNEFRVSFSPAAMQKEDAVARLSDAIYAMPMMQDQKLILITDLAPATATKETFDAVCAALAEANDAQDTVLILYCRSSELETDYKLETSSVFKKLSASATMVRFDLQPRAKLIGWIKRHFSEERLAITDEAAGLLADLCTGRMTPILFEMQKLVCYAASKSGDTPTIDVSDVEQIVVPSDPDEMPFAMLNAAQNWRLSEMLAVFDAAKEQREEPIAVLARLSRIFLDMLLIKALSDEALPTAEIAKTMKMKDFRITKYREAVARVPIGAIERAISLCYDTDVAIKSCPTDAWVMLDALAVQIYAPKSLRNPTA